MTNEILDQNHSNAILLNRYGKTKITEQEKAKVKKVVQTLLKTLKREKLALDWHKKQQAKAAEQITIDDILDRLLPATHELPQTLRIPNTLYYMKG